MLARLRSWLLTPRFDTEEQTRAARLLHAALLLTLGVALAAGLYGLRVGAPWTPAALSALALAAVLLAPLSHGRLRRAGWPLVGLWLLMLSLAGLLAPSLRPVWASGYLLTVVLAGLALGASAAQLTGGLAALAALAALGAADWPAVAAVLAAATFLTVSAARGYTAALRQALERRAQREAANAELEARIAARTAELEALNQQLQQELAERSRTEAQLRRSQDLLDGFLNALDDPVFVKDAQHRWVIVNDSFCAQIGRPRAELIGRSDYDLFPAEQADVFWQYDRQVLDTGTTNVNEEQITWAAGTRTISTKKSLFRDPITGDPFIVASIRDLTERQLAEERLFQSQQMLQRVLDNVPQRVFWKDRASRFLGCNRSFARDAGLASPEQVIGRTDLELPWHDLAAGYRADDQQVMDTDTPKLNYEEPQHTADGTQFWLRTNKVPLHDRDGRVIGVLGTYEDITERRQAEAALRRSERNYREIFNATSDAILIHDAETGRILDVNAAMLALYGYRYAEALALTVGELSEGVPPYSEADAQIWRQKAIQAGPQLFEWRARRRDGQLFWVEVALRSSEISGHGRVLSVVRDISARKQTEEALRASQERLSTVVANAPVVLFAVDTAGTFTLSEGRGLAALGLQPGEVIGRSAFELYADVPAIGQALRGALAGATLHERVTVGALTFDTAFTPLREDAGAVVGVIGLAVDVTERQRAEDALRQTQAKFAAFFQLSPDALSISRLDDGWLLDVNDGFTASTGYSAAEACGRTRAELELYADPADWQRLWAQLTAAGVVRDFEADLRRKDGAQRTFSISARVVELDGLAHFFTIGRDITERKRADAALRASEARYRTTLAHIDEIIYMTHPSAAHPDRSEVAFISDRVEAILGFPAAAFAQDQGLWSTLVHPDDIPAWQAQTAALYLDKQPVTREYRLRRADTTYRQIEDRVVPQLDEHERVVATFGVARDITERKQAEAERERLIAELGARNTELERFTYTVSHDLKSPLITIKGYLGYLEQDAVAGHFERFRADLARIGNAAEKMQQLLEELLELSRVGRLMNAPEALPLTALVQEALALTAGRLEQRGVAVTLAPDLPAVYGDRPRLREVFANLLDNAAKFMGEQPEPRIEIGVRSDGAARVICVRDNGLGIDPRYHEKIFGLFEKLDAHGAGTGIGLALVRRIVEVHGGRIWAESAGLGQGTTFCLTLPEPPAENAHAE
mgnify:CR=1 FL=1